MAQYCSYDTDQGVPALPTPLISLYSFVDGLACLFLRSDPQLNLKKIFGGGLTFGPPQYLYHGYAPANDP